jgi:hypothetical protein
MTVLRPAPAALELALEIEQLGIGWPAAMQPTMRDRFAPAAAAATHLDNMPLAQVFEPVVV